LTTPQQTGGRARRLAAVLGWALFLLAFGYVLLYGGTYAGINLAPLRTFSLALIVGGLVAWAALAWRYPDWRPRTVLWPALLVAYAALVLATLTSPYPRFALDYLLWVVLLVALYLLLVRVMARPFVQVRLGPLLALFSLALSGIYVAIVFGRWLEWWDLIGRFSAPMLRPAYTGLLSSGPTVVAPTLVLLGVSAIASLGFETRRRQVTSAVIVVLTLAAVFLSGSRASWLGLAAAIGLIGLGLLVAYRDRLGALLRDRRVQAGLGAVVVVMIITATVMGPAVLDRATSGGDGGRGTYFVTAQRMFEESPLTGQGPGNWAARQFSYLEPGELHIHIVHAHNPYIQTLAESGLVGIAAGIVGLGVLLWLIVHSLRRGDARRRLWAVAALFVLIYLGTAFLFDSWWNVPMLMMLAGLPFAFLDGAAEHGPFSRTLSLDERTRGRLAIGAGVAVFVVSALAVVGLLRIEQAASAHLNAAAAVDDKDWAVAYELATEAVTTDPEMVPYQVTYGITAAANGDWDVAADAFERAATTDQLPQSWLNLAKARLELGLPDEAVIEAIEMARFRADDTVVVVIAAASLYDQLGLTDEADALYTEAVRAMPDLAADGEWWADPALAPRYPDILEGAIAASDAPWVIAMMAGDYERATALTQADGDDLVVTVVEAWSGDPAALLALQDLALERPKDSRRTVWATRASARAGDPDAEARFRRIAQFEYEGLSPLGWEARILGGSGVQPERVVSPGFRYGRESYRRWMPRYLLVPGIAQLGFVDSTLPDEPDQTDP
jgi:O-antigen ligase